MIDKVELIKKKAASLSSSWKHGDPSILDRLPIEAVVALEEKNPERFIRFMDNFLPSDLSNTDAAAICYAVCTAHMDARNGV